MGKADGLSQRVYWKVGVDKDNDNQVFIKDNWICSMYEVVVKGPEVELVEKIKKARSKDEELRTEVIQLHHDVLAAGHGGR